MSEAGWALEVVRGREVGRRYALSRSEMTLGNALNGAPGIDLSTQEGDGPRRMAAKQAMLEWSASGLQVRDLESPGGTFVNRQRLLSGQSKALIEGDVLQLGGVQLRIVARVDSKSEPARPQAVAKPAPAPTSVKPAPQVSTASTPQAKAKPGPLPAPFTLASGAICRTWDDFLTVSAQRWPALRDELTSGRLGAFLASNRLPEMVPSPDAPGSPDERLDAWLAALPTTRPSVPEIEVHPLKLSVRATGGGTRRQTVQITNVGYRLLRTTVRVEPDSATWVRVAPEFARGPFVTVERTDLAIDLQIPDNLVTPLAAALVIEGNGGTRRVEVRLERPPASDVLPDVPASSGRVDWGLSDAIARQSLRARIVYASVGLLLIRLLIAVAGLLFGGVSTMGVGPPFRGPAVMLALAGGLVASALAMRRGEGRDLPPSAFAGAFVGLLAAAIAVAACQTIEPVVGRILPPSLVTFSLLWAAIGAGLAVLSTVFVAPRSVVEGAPR